MKKLCHGKIFDCALCTFTFFWLLFSNSILNVYAFDFEEKELNYNESEYSNFHLINEELKNERINDYDINEKNEIAVATNKYINIYNEFGDYLYGYSVFCSGAYAIDFDIDKIDIYRIKQGDLIRMNRNGDIINIADIESNPKNEKELSKVLDNMRKTVKNAGEYRYKINSSLTTLIQIDSKGNKVLIYKTKNLTRIKGILFTIIIFSIVIFVFLKVKAKNHNPSDKKHPNL